MCSVLTKAGSFYASILPLATSSLRNSQEKNSEFKFAYYYQQNDLNCQFA
jgi:hypothetical protein